MFFEPIKQVTDINFGIFNNDDVLQYSVMDKETGIKEQYLNTAKTSDEGINSRKLGAKKDNICLTCGLGYENCPGHFGHINLGKPVFHIGFIDYVKKILNCVCVRCGKLKIDITNHLKNIEKLTAGERLKYISNICSSNNKYCTYCKALLPKIELQNKKSNLTVDFIMKIQDSSMNMNAVYDNKDMEDHMENKKLNNELNAEIVFNIFKKIDDQTWRYLGFNPEKVRPEDLILYIFPVSPTTIRPTNEEKGLISDDQLTKNLADIIKYNNKLNECLTNNSGDYNQADNYQKYIQCQTGLYYDWSNRHLPLNMVCKNEGDDKSICGRIIGRKSHKEGRIRGNIMGKRTDWTARTVITGDTCIRPNEIGCPVYIAKRLTYPEIVTEFNIDILRLMVKNGYNKYPGATTIIDKTGHKQDLKFAKSKEINIGDIVERNLVDGDIVWFNRQPSLHKYSTMAHHVKIIDDDTYMSFRLNVGVTSPYNADFDGDEMNLIVPRSIQTKIELDKLMNVKHNFISAQNNQPLIGCKLDSIVGPFLATYKDFELSGNIVMNLLSYLFEPIDKKFTIDVNKKYTGKEFFSYILPQNINFKANGLTIKNGQLIDGYLKKSFVGDGQNDSLIKLILDIYGENEAVKFMVNIMRLANVFNMWYGFTTSCYDIQYSDELRNKFRKIIQENIIKSNLETTEVENDPNIMNIDSYEKYVKGMLEVVRTNIGNQFLETIKKDKKNNLSSIISSNSGGSKVGPDSIARNVALEGQLIIDDVRFPFLDGRRIQPYFNRDSNLATDRGFNIHGFFDGLTWPEYCFNAMVGRKAKADEKSKTADSGALSRKMAIIMEDYYESYDMTVRDIKDNIIQFIFGDNNIDPEKQYIYTLNILKMNDDEIKKKYFYKNENFYKKLCKYRNEIRDAINKVYINKMPSDFPNKIKIPINFRYIDNFINSKQNEINKTDLTEDFILKELKNLLNHNNIKLNCYTNNKSIKAIDEKYSKKLIKLYIYSVLSPKQCIEEYKINKNDFNEIIKFIISNFKTNIIQPGECVGILSAYSISQPITQAGLRSTHASGMGGGFSLADIKQMLDISESLHNPMMTIVLDEETRNNKNKVNYINYSIKQTKLENIRNNIEIIYDPDNEFYEKDEIINTFNKKDDKVNNKMINWLFRIFLNKEQLLLTNITLFDIMNKIDDEFTYRNINKKKEKKSILQNIKSYKILANNDNNDKPIIHLRLQLSDVNINLLNNIVDVILDDILIKGLNNIDDSNIIERNNRFITDKDGSLKQEKENIIITKGINNIDIRYLNGVDLTQTICNNVNDIYELYGIEAVRTYIIEVLLDFIGKDANYNHISLLTDYICHYSYPIAINFHGMMKTDAAITSEAALQQPMTVLQDAAVFSKSDKVHGVSSQIITGQCITRGSCTCKLLFDTEKVLNSEYVDTNYTRKSNNIDVIQNIIDNTKDINEIFIPDEE
jgi:DNA-directed RNA polymerase II subunit RPB1